MSKIEMPVKESALFLDAPDQEPGEDSVRAYAYHLYQETGCTPGHDLDNWFEASACLKAHIPAHASHRRLSQQVSDLTKSGPLFISQAMAKREIAVLRRGREELAADMAHADALCLRIGMSSAERLKRATAVLKYFNVNGGEE